ncbi:MAG: NAD+ synthase [Elusimicrobiota bacterium]
MKIALAQINTTVGDIRGNLESIRSSYRKARALGVDVVLFPELTITGYPPRDLLEHPDFIRANLGALKTLARSAGNTGLIVGYAAENPSRTGKPLQNAAALLHRGKIVAKRCKTLLPTYDVFDEGRYFEPAKENKPFRFHGRRIGLTICEDAWNDEDLLGRRRYALDPIRRHAAEGADLMLNIAASPYERGKVALRNRVLRAHAAKTRRPLACCALVGGNDELLFDGNSFALDARGRLVRQGKAFEEDLLVIDPAAEVPAARWSELDDIEELYRALVLGIRDYARKCAFRDVVVGLSGGIDSAVTCALAADALGPDHVMGVALPSMHSSEGSVADAQALANNLGVRLFQFTITGVYDAMMAALSEAFRDTPSGLAEQNLQARIRGNLLMALSNKTGALLLSTGNKSELSVGYCTLYGDMSGGLGVIADVLKTSVYALARWMNRDGERIPQSSIDKPPSAELKPDQTDQDDLPPYGVLDSILRAYVEEGQDASSIARLGHPKSLVAEVLDRVDRNEYKRRQAPPALRVSPKAFGGGRRMPIARGRHRL